MATNVIERTVRRSALLSIALGIAGACATRAASAQIALGSVDLRLGDTKASVLAQLRPRFRVDSLDGRDQWLILNRDGPPFRAVGTVGFRASRLALITRSWNPGPSERTQPDLMRAVLGAMQTLMVDRLARCTLVDRSNRAPSVELTTIELECGARRVSFGLAQGEGGTSVSITELLGPDLP